MRDALDQFRDRLAGGAPRTTTTYLPIVASFASTIAARVPTPGDVERFLATPRRDGATRSPSSRNQWLAALRQYAALMVREGHWPVDPTAGIEFRRTSRRDPVFLTLDEIPKLFQAVASHSAAEERTRNLAIVSLLVHTGLRVHELVGLGVDQIDPLSKNVLGMRGKGGTKCNLPLSASCLAFTTAWIATRTHHAASGETALLVGPSGGPLSVRTVERLFVDLRDWMGTQKKLTPHAMRHTFVTSLIESGVDLVTASKLARHSSIAVTERYVHLMDTRLREAVERLDCAVPASLLPAPREIALVPPTTQAVASETTERLTIPESPTLDREEHFGVA